MTDHKNIQGNRISMERSTIEGVDWFIFKQGGTEEGLIAKIDYGLWDMMTPELKEGLISSIMRRFG